MNRQRPTVFLAFFSGIIALSIHGCYTTFSHPPIPDSEWGAVRINDECRECHQQTRFREAIVPAAAEHDDSWLFYSGSPWWQDEPEPTAFSAEPPETTGPRSFGSSSSYEAPATAPYAMPTVQTLGKSGADESEAEPSQPKDERRSFERRSDARSTADSSGNSDASRSRRK